MYVSYVNIALTVLRRLHDEINPSGKISINVKDMLKSWADIELQASPGGCRSGLWNDFPPQILFHQDIILGPSALYRLLCDYPVLNGSKYEQRPDTTRIVISLANGFLQSMQIEHFLFVP